MAHSFDIVPGGFVAAKSPNLRDRLWTRTPLPAFDIAPGVFNAWIAATDLPPHQGGGSACAWEIRRHGECTPVAAVDIRSGDGKSSDEQRAYVAGVLGVLERLPYGSSVFMRCKAEWVMIGIGGSIDTWDADRRLRKCKISIAAWSVWQKILEQRKRIGGVPTDFRGELPRSDEDYEIIERLQEKARSVRPKRSQGR